MYNDIHQWYMDIDANTEKVGKYEDLIVKYYRNLGANLDQRLIKPFLTKFYERDRFSKYIVKLLPLQMLYAFGTGLIGFLGSFAYQIIKGGLGNIMDNLGSYFAASGQILLVTFMVALVLLFLFHFLRNLVIKKSLRKLENELKPVMISLPAAYRSYNKMFLIAQTYFAVKGIAPEKAFYISDNYDGDELEPRPIPGIMFDQPFQNAFVKDETYTVGELKASPDTEGFAYNNEYLPSDIKQRTFEGSKNAEADLYNMIGLNSVKEQIEKLKNRIQFYGSSNVGSGGNHMMFLGGAGSGKTSMARIVSKILNDLGYIRKNQVVEISGDYLRSGDSNRALAIVEYSYGGVLFIDEAYLLYDKNGSGNEAIGILLKAMEDHRNDFVVILAGYEEQMTRLIASNEGFSSRIKHTIYFPDYTDEEMLEIFKSFIKNYGGKSYVLGGGVESALIELFKLEKRSSSFGNARTVRNAVDGILDYYVDRSLESNTDTRVIDTSDVERYFEDRKNVIQHEMKNASAVNQIDESIIRLSELKSKLKEGSDNPLDDLDKMVGLEDLKEELKILKNQKEFYNSTKQQRILIVGECGKSSIARIMTGYLYDLGYIQENKFLDVNAELFKGSYVGHTTKRAESIISYASGGVLFIKNINRVANGGDAFDNEALGVITDALRNNENVTMMIGDTDSQYIQSIASLFDIVYYIPTFSKEQLCKIFVTQANQEGFSVQNEAIKKLETIVTENTGVRGVINQYNQAKKKHMTGFTEETKYIITEDDVEKPTLKLKINRG